MPNGLKPALLGGSGVCIMMAFDYLEYTTPQDPCLNFLWWPYEPVASAENKFRSVNLLFHSFGLVGIDERAYRIVQAIRNALGLFRTVWGVKWLRSQLIWEFYFYDYKRQERDVSIRRLLNAINPFIQCSIKVNETIPYFMFSLDIRAEVISGDRVPEEIHIYIGNPGSTVPSGIAYACRPGHIALENFYFFFDVKRHLQQAVEKIYCSAHVDVSQMDINTILWPELCPCENISVANKPYNDAIYFSGVTVCQLLFFLKQLNYPSEIISFVEENQARLDHLLYDVGFDYVTQGDTLQIVKSGYYGVF